MGISGTTRIYAVVGDPIAHTLSPAMHNAAIRTLGLDAVYVAARSSPQALPGLVFGILTAGGGLNVTLPFKLQAAGLVDHPTDAVRRTGACNTIWGDPDHPSGDNTDVDGIRLELRRLTAGTPVGSVLVVGTGGSARAGAVAVSEEFPGAHLAVRSRDKGRSGVFAEWAWSVGVDCHPVHRDGAVDLMISTVPLDAQLAGQVPPDLYDFQPKVVLDLAYAPGGTPVTRAFAERGCVTSDGLGVLIGQGAAAFQRFFGVPAPTDVMRHAVEDALGR
ncbi:MAG TPA: shikimate dehydrogenase [Gemmatimonadales bacterium]|nr:shikimate dehydrogenase [Gemmatimonadales bacterium]